MGIATKFVRLLSVLGIASYVAVLAKMFSILIGSTGWGAIIGWFTLLVLAVLAFIPISIILLAIMMAKYDD